MTDRPILFSGPMVRALLDGRKTQTRRVMNPQPYEYRGEWWITDRVSGDCMLDDWVGDRAGLGPAYATGDRLWVREAWRTWVHLNDTKPSLIVPSDQVDPVVEYAATPPGPKDPGRHLGRLRPGMHMPRWASRLTLTVTDVRVERVQAITEADARAEGCTDEPMYPEMGTVVHSFADLWDSLNEPRGYGWDANPWVAAYSFTVERRNIDEVQP